MNYAFQATKTVNYLTFILLIIFTVII